MIYRVTHTTQYNYEEAVSQCLNEVRVTPRELPTQRVKEHAIDVKPEPASFSRRVDYFGNSVTAFAVFEKHTRLETVARSVVEVARPKQAGNGASSWEQARDLLATEASGPALEALEFVFDSPFIPTGPALAEYARPTFKPERPLLEALQELNHRIHTEFRYEPKSTSIEMPLLTVLENRRGVCQDFAHVMIGALRSMRLAARYVSGYLRSGAGFQGAQASHAWVSAYIPEMGWRDFDPTNNVMPSDGHITLAWGRDYGDVTPVKGIALGGGGQSVEVAVVVHPDESFQAS